MDAKTPSVVAVTGYRNSGKTTAIEEIVRALGRQGGRVATIKHCHHGADIDRPGKDSWRHREAGACGTAVVGPGGMAVMREDPTADPVALAGWVFPDADLVLAEGFHWLPLPRVEVEDADGAVRDAHPDGPVVARLPHRFGTREIARACGRLQGMIDDARLPEDVAA